MDQALVKGKSGKKGVVDFAIGVRCGRSKRIQLVEAKFNVKDLKNVEVNDIQRNVNHSKEVLMENGMQISSGAVILIGKSNRVQQQKNVLFRRLVGKNEYRVRTVQEFYGDYFSEN